MKTDFCKCEDFKKAQEVGTDNEGYSAAIRPWDKDGTYAIGNGLTDISFCPWCGCRVPPIEELSK